MIGPAIYNLISVGWIGKAVLFPLLKACFSGHLNESEIKYLLSSLSFKSLVSMLSHQMRYSLLHAVSCHWRANV